MKQLSSAVLESPFSEYAADRIDGAINVADKYVEKYLPSEDQIDCKYWIIVHFKNWQFKTVNSIGVSHQQNGTLSTHR